MGFPISQDLSDLLPDVQQIQQVEHIPKIKAKIDEIRRMLTDYGIFESEPEKVDLWIEAKNPGFGYISPLQLICIGREKKVEEFILVARYENGDMDDAEDREFEKRFE